MSAIPSAAPATSPATTPAAAPTSVLCEAALWASPRVGTSSTTCLLDPVSRLSATPYTAYNTRLPTSGSGPAPSPSPNNPPPATGNSTTDENSQGPHAHTQPRSHRSPVTRTLKHC